MTTTIRTRHYKYRRPAEVPTVALTEDDDRILLETYRHKVIDSATIYKLLAPRTPDRLRRRLLALWQVGYLERRSELEQLYKPGGGSYPIAYTLTTRGARRVQEVFDLRIRHERYKGLTKKRSPSFLVHDLEQTRFMVATRQALLAQGDVEFLYPDEIYHRYAPEILERRSLPTTIKAKVQLYSYVGTEGTQPDGFFMLRYRNRPEGKNRRALFLEIDRGTETVDVGVAKQKQPKFWGSSSLLRKFLIYGYAWKQKSHVEDFGIPTFQVITVTTTPGHIEKIQAMYEKRLKNEPHRIDPRLFLFTDFATIDQYTGNILTVPFEDAAGREVRLG